MGVFDAFDMEQLASINVVILYDSWRITRFGLTLGLEHKAFTDTSKAIIHREFY